MILLAHVTTGAVIGLKFQDPTIVILLSFLSHFILDRLPHWNYDVPKKAKSQAFLTMLPDIIPTVLVWLVFIFTYPDHWLIISVGVAFAILPDFISLGWYFPSLKKIVLPFLKFHKMIQGEISKKYNRALWGLSSQIIYLTLLILFFIKF
ncbi:MAG: hypothetical protein Q8P20_02180 [bacterium]|nr:hypothetical protein [bacterium]